MTRDLSHVQSQFSTHDGVDDSARPHLKFVAIFATLLMVELICDFILFVPGIGIDSKSFELIPYHLWETLMDVPALSALRVASGIFGIYRSYKWTKMLPLSPFELFHPNGDKKTPLEVDEEALEEGWKPFLKRFTNRPSFPLELIVCCTLVNTIFKCLCRLYVEIGIMEDGEPHDPAWWIVVGVYAMYAILEWCFADIACECAGKWGIHVKDSVRKNSTQYCSVDNLNVNSHLCDALLSSTDEETISSAFSNTLTSVGDIEFNDGTEALQHNNQNMNMDINKKQDDIQAQNKNDKNSQMNDKKCQGKNDISSISGYKAGWTDLLGISAPDSHLILIAFIFLIAAALAQIAVPHFTGIILDSLVQTGDTTIDKLSWEKEFRKTVWKLIIASVCAGVFAGIRGSIFTVVGGRINIRLRTCLMSGLLAQDIGFFDSTKTGEITSRLCSDTTLVGDQVTLNVNIFLRSFVQAIGVLIFMFFISWQLSMLALISIPSILLLSKTYGAYMRRLTKLQQKKLADGNSLSEAAIGSMSTVRAFGAEASEMIGYEKCMDQYLVLTVRGAFAYVGYMFFMASLPYLVTCLVLFYGGLLVVSDGDDQISSGQLVTFILYLSSLSDAFNNLGNIMSSLTQAVGAADKVFELMKRKPAIRETTLGSHNNNISNDSTDNTLHDCKRGLNPEQCMGEVELENVYMSYPARPKHQVLNGMSLKASAGTVVALCGQSGGGKSSVISLIQHLYEPSRGNILIDGFEVHELSYDWISRHVSVVSQEPILFARSIFRNIIYGLEGTEYEPSLDDVKEAAKLANACSFIEKMPQGYDTDVGERGVQLSGGQKQRIAIARALVRKPKILLLDEATSALDAESEAAVQDSIDSMLKRDDGSNSTTSMTVIVIAHRLSTIRNADLIYVVESGHVVEKGSHHELLKLNGAYTNLVNCQMEPSTAK